MPRIATALVALSLLACGGGGGSDPVPTVPPVAVNSCPIPSVPATPSWSAHIYPFIQQSCGSQSVSCHNNPGTRVNFNLSQSLLYAALVDQPTTALSGWFYIRSGDDLTAPNRRSWIYEKVDPLVVGSPGGGIGTTMPAGSSLCRPTIDTLKAWIIAGAPNN